MSKTLQNFHNQPIVFFDGYCHFCQNSVQFIIRNERDSTLLFAPLTGSTYASLIEKNPLPHPLPDSIIVFVDGEWLLYSDAILFIAKYLKVPYRYLSVFKIFPKSIRNFVYRFIAKNRYKWFGKSEYCFLPSPEQKLRFLD